MNLKIIRRSRHIWFSSALWNRRILFIAGATAVGFAAVLFATAAMQANRALHWTLLHWPWAPFVLTPLGFGLTSWITTRFFPGAQGSGIPQTIAGLGTMESGLRNQLLALRIAWGKVLLTLIGLLSGASIGREGPTVQVGAAIMYSLTRLSPFPHEGMKRGLILAGGAAAAFNAPLAGSYLPSKR